MTADRLSCSHSMEKTKSFRLKHGNKHYWFDCHRQFLPMDHTFRRNKSAFSKNNMIILCLHWDWVGITYGTMYHPSQKLLIIEEKSLAMENLIIGQEEVYYGIFRTGANY